MSLIVSSANWVLIVTKVSVLRQTSMTYCPETLSIFTLKQVFTNFWTFLCVLGSFTSSTLRYQSSILFWAVFGKLVTT